MSRLGVYLLLPCVLLAISPACVAMTWHDWWETKDSQGYRLFQAGEHQQAFESFARPDWKAAAAYKSGRYQDAVTWYQKMDDVDSKYNQANALAHLGNYSAALNVLNQVLEQSPSHADALYNRDIIKKLLEESQKKNNPSSSQDKPDQDKPDQDKPDQDKPDQDKPGQDKPGQDKPDQDKPGQDKPGQDKPDQDKPGQDKPGQDKPGQDKPDQDKPDQDKPGQDKPGQDKPGQDKPGQDKPDQDKPGQDKSSEGLSASLMSDEEKEHWLSFIADEPGAFLKEKFLRDYLRRH